jgi:hypothetical protein
MEYVDSKTAKILYRIAMETEKLIANRPVDKKRLRRDINDIKSNIPDSDFEPYLKYDVLEDTKHAEVLLNKSRRRGPNNHRNEAKQVKAINCSTKEEKTYKSIYNASKDLAINSGLITNCCNGTQYAKGGTSKKDNQKYTFELV